MADSVDTMIENAYNRARYWGLVADNMALSAKNGVDPFAGGYSKIAQPPKYATAPSLPAFPTDAQMEAFRQAFERMLDDFFGQYFDPSDAYLAAEAWVINTLTDGYGTLPGNSVGEIWGRAQNNTLALGNDLDGLDLPAEALTPHQTLAYGAFAHARNYSESMVKVDLWNHAAAFHLRDLRADAITAIGEYIRARANADLAPLNAQTAIATAQIAAQNAAASWYTAQLGPTERDVKRTVISKTEDRNSEMIGDDLVVKNMEMFVKAAINAADAVANVAQAATASMNSVIGSSTVGFQ